jgi:hypothetical protein
VTGRTATGARSWDDRYRSIPNDELSWYQPTATTSLDLIDQLDLGPAEGILDVGGGASTLVDGLVARGHTDLGVLDLSGEALAIARRRIPDAPVRWIVADVTTWTPSRRWALWHDRATFHFLTAPEQRAGYLAALDLAVPPGGAIVVATFGPDGPERCSGQGVERYDADGLVATLTERIAVEVVAERTEAHPTPGGATQQFTWVACRRTA